MKQKTNLGKIVLGAVLGITAAYIAMGKADNTIQKTIKEMNDRTGYYAPRNTEYNMNLDHTLSLDMRKYWLKKEICSINKTQTYIDTRICKTGCKIKQH